MVDWSLSFSPAFTFSDWTRIAASTSLSQELTEPDGDDDPHTILFSDVQLSIARPLYQFEDGPRIGPNEERSSWAL